MTKNVTLLGELAARDATMIEVRCGRSDVLFPELRECSSPLRTGKSRHCSQCCRAYGHGD